MKMQASAVKKYAMEKNLLLMQPEKLKNPDFIQQLRSVNADLQVVVAFRMLPEVVWNMPPMGTINLHGSLLPDYRGAAPINWAIINGEEKTGVTTFKLQHEIDTGPILLQEIIKIEADETAGSLHDRMKEIGSALVVKTVMQLADNTISEMVQRHPGELKTAPKIFTETCQVNWNEPVEKINNLVRGLSPYPAAYTFLEGKKLKVLKAHIENKKPSTLPGNFETDGHTYLKFAANDGYLLLADIQLEGKKRMNIKEFLRGYRFNSLP
jgi:methionyl-tRNA formyltransferase